MSLLPVFMKMAGRRVLVVGAGNVAAEKIESLLQAEAAITVVAPSGLESVARMADEGQIVWLEREFAESDLDGVFLVIAATASADVNHRVFALAVERGILCNAVDDPPYCDFYFGSVVRRGDLVVGVSTGGESPAVAQGLRRELEAALPRDLGPWLSEMGRVRREVLASHSAGTERKALLHTLAGREVCGAVECPTRLLARRGL